MSKQVRKRTILIADDESEVVQLVQMILEWEGYTVIAAADGLETLQRVEMDKPDLILLDVRMPKMSGLTVLDHLARSETAGHPGDHAERGDDPP